jgi:D-cysteine desulfhydrase
VYTRDVAELALVRAYPALRRTLPRRVFVEGPTPVEGLPLPGVPEGMVFVKRDDRSCPLYGGNKPRKLELVIGAALARGSKRLVTTGGLGTHHGLATALLGREAGLATTLVLVHQPVTAEVVETLALCDAWGARLLYGANVPGAIAQAARALTGSVLRGERPTLVATGGSSPRGNLGFVSAALELAEQVRDGALPEPAEIWLPVGSGGTLAGLAVGIALSGLRTRLRGVLVTDILPPSPRRLARAARRTLRLLRRLAPDAPPVRVAARDLPLVRDQLGAGYGAATPAAEEALAIAREHGLRLETTYTAKCLAALLARVRRGSLPGPVLFWNTFNAVDVTARAPILPDPARLRGPIGRLVRDATDRATPPGVV